MKYPYPILDLPDPIQRAMIKKFSPTEAIEMAIKFPSFRKVLSKHKLPAKIFQWKWDVDRWASGTETYVQVEFGEGQRIRLIRPRQNKLRRSYQTRRSLKVEDFDFEIETTRDNVRVLEPRAFVHGLTDWELLEVYTVFLLDLVRVEKFELKGRFNKEYPCLDCFVWKYSRKFGKIDSDTSDEENFEKVFKFLNEQVNVYELALCANPPIKSPHTAPLSGETVSLKNVDFLHPDAILNSKCASITLTCSHLKFSVLNSLIKTWMNGGLQNLKEFSVFDYLIKDEDLLESIVTLKKSISPDEAVRGEVQRSTDGARATIFCRYAWFFEFKVVAEEIYR